MTHDQLKSAIRERMAQTGEPYMVARRECLREREAPGGHSGLKDIERDVVAAQQAAADLGPVPPAW